MKDAILHILRSRIAWAMIGLILGHLLGYQRAQQQIAECYNSITPQALMSNCPRWLR